MIRKILKLFFIGLSLFFWVACQSKNPKAEFTVGMESFPNNLDPRYPTDAYASKVQALIFNGLFKIDENLHLVPDLVQRFDYVSPTRLHFQLKPNIPFHDGHVLTSRDVVYTFQSILNRGSRSPLAEVFKKVKKIQAIDALNFEIELQEPFAPFLTSLTVGILPENADAVNARPFSERPIGTGPFRFRQQKKGQWIILDRFADFFAEKARLPSLKIEAVQDDTTRVLKLLHGELDFIQNAVPLIMVKWLQEHKSNFEWLAAPGINYAYLGLNLKDPILKKLKVRQAMALAIDRTALIRSQLKGFARPATGILAPSNPYYEATVKDWSYDPVLAKKLLDEAGYPDPDGDGPQKRFTISYKSSNKRDRIVLARALGRYFEAVGIGVEVKSYEWGTFYRDIRTGNFQVFSSSWVGVSDPDIYYNIFHSQMIPPQGANRGHYQDTALDQNLSLARADANPEIRKAYYSGVQKKLAEDLPYISLWYEDNIAFINPQFLGYELRPDASLLGLVKVYRR